jgi:hypothetical protein
MIQNVFLDVRICRSDVIELHDISDVARVPKLGKGGVVF